MTVDTDRIEAAVREILDAIGEDPDRNGLLDTPRRVAAMYEELFVGLHSDPSEHLQVTFEEHHDEMVMVRDIPFTSLCEHHLVPFMGKAHVAYIPGVDGKITGLSKLARLVDGFARRLQVQERMTAQIADSLDTVELVMALEDEFGIEIPDEDAEKITTVSQAISYINDRRSKP